MHGHAVHTAKTPPIFLLFNFICCCLVFTVRLLEWLIVQPISDMHVVGLSFITLIAESALRRRHSAHVPST